MIIKNKFRTNVQAPVVEKKQEVYQPEYKRIGITPVQADSRTRNLAINQAVPRNIRVNSGQNDELVWMSKSRPVKNNVKDENEEILIKEVRERTFVNENFEDGVNRNTPIAYDDIPEYTKSPVISEQTVVSAMFEEVAVGDFVLIFENEILGSGSFEEVTNAVEEILLSDESGTISPKSLVVLKRMQIVTGVLIKDV